MSLSIRNPHSALLAIEHRPKDVAKLISSDPASSEGWAKVLQAARKRGIRIEAPKKGSQPSRGMDGRAGLSGELVVEPRQAVSLYELFPEEPSNGLWLALDCVQDPHNVGAIFRTAAFFGVQGILLTFDRSAPLTSTVYDVASGGMETIPHAQETNLAQSLKFAKERGYWILGTAEEAKAPLSGVKPDRAWVLVLGNEEKGMRRLTREHCDEICSIPSKGGVGSLNVSSAAAVLISHLSS